MTPLIFVWTFESVIEAIIMGGALLFVLGYLFKWMVIMPIIEKFKSKKKKGD